MNMCHVEPVPICVKNWNWFYTLSLHPPFKLHPSVLLNVIPASLSPSLISSLPPFINPSICLLLRFATLITHDVNGCGTINFLWNCKLLHFTKISNFQSWPNFVQISKLIPRQTTDQNNSWWCHDMETLCALHTLCEGNLPVTVQCIDYDYMA